MLSESVSRHPHPRVPKNVRACFVFPRIFVSKLGTRTGQTDGQTNTRNAVYRTAACQCRGCVHVTGSSVFRDGIRERRRSHVSHSGGRPLQRTRCRVRIFTVGLMHSDSRDAISFHPFYQIWQIVFCQELLLAFK